MRGGSVGVGVGEAGRRGGDAVKESPSLKSINHFVFRQTNEAEIHFALTVQ